MGSKPLLIGQAPSRTSDPSRPFSGPVGARLAAIALVGDLGEAFELRNLLPEWPGKRGKGDAFPIGPARLRAHEILAECAEGRRIVFVGRNVARAFGEAERGFFETIVLWPGLGDASSLAWTIPHPSGVNLAMNDPWARERIFWLFRSLLS